MASARQIDSIVLWNDANSFDITIVEWDENFGSPQLVDALQTDTQVGRRYRDIETTISHATIEANHIVGFVRSSDTGKNTRIRVHYTQE